MKLSIRKCMVIAQMGIIKELGEVLGMPQLYTKRKRV
jgi:hypothetical protein